MVWDASLGLVKAGGLVFEGVCVPVEQACNKKVIERKHEP